VADPLSIHWHGIILPNGQDGVPYVTQPPIKPGERRLYDFPLVQAGTYWMHSHFGLQEQLMLTAPLIIRESPAGPEMKDVVIMLNDFTTREPSAILADLRRRPRPAMKMGGAGMKMDGGKMKSGAGMKMPMKADLTDVQYDALLANRRPLSDPEVVQVTSGEVVRLRIINMTSASNLFLSTGRLAAVAIAPSTERTSCLCPACASNSALPSASTFAWKFLVARTRTRSSPRRRARICWPVSFWPRPGPPYRL
jgi:FtsP/CotA-like multicopper oxidase with cupredoxin domain